MATEAVNSDAMMPRWQQLVMLAEDQTADMQLSKALASYRAAKDGDMPLDARYTTQLSMAILLRRLGFPRRAELVLYEATSLRSQPYEANLQLALLALDREDLREAKMHFKNCLYYRATDVNVLVYLSTVLVAEGRSNEAKFFVSQLLSALEVRVRKLLVLMGREESDLVTIMAPISSGEVLRWLETLMARVLHGRLSVTPSSNLEMIRMFSNVYMLLVENTLTGRHAFDMGQGLYEGGRPETGLMMMRRGYETTKGDDSHESAASFELVGTRLAIDFPMVPVTLAEVVGRIGNITTFLAASAGSMSSMIVENALDIYWAVPLLGWSGLGVASLQAELLRRFDNIPVRIDPYGSHFLRLLSQDESNLPIPNLARAGIDAETKLDDMNIIRGKLDAIDLGADFNRDTVDVVVGGVPLQVPKGMVVNRANELQGGRSTRRSGKRQLLPKGSVSENVDVSAVTMAHAAIRVEVGIFGGHMNSHPVGRAVLSRLLDFHSGKSHIPRRERFRITLLALPLLPDEATRKIARSIERVVNLPADVSVAWALIEGLHLDVLLVPDWQPFPDTHSVLFSSARIAPIQACFYVRGSACPAAAMDYYLLPEELVELYLNDVPAVATPPSPPDWVAAARGDNSNSKMGADDATPEEEAARLRLQWLAPYLEQVVLVPDWPVVTCSSIREAQHAAVREVIGTTTTTSLKDTDLLLPIELEGQDDSVTTAVLAIHPSQLHPLMDSVLLKLLLSAPTLHLVLVMPDAYFRHSSVQDADSRYVWARALVRRLWKNGPNLHQRVRLLPAPLPDRQLLALYKQVDLVLDSFPVGTPAHYVELALSVGTPVMTMRTGSEMETPAADVRHIRQNNKNKNKNAGSNTTTHGSPLQPWLDEGKVPWRPTVSALTGFYASIGLTHELSATSMNDYLVLATRLAVDSDLRYRLRIKILEAVDYENDDVEGEDVATFTDGLWNFVHRIATPWSVVRTEYLSRPEALAAVQANREEARAVQKRRSSATE